MRWNMNFEIAALIFLLFILYHFLSQKKLDNANSRIFTFFIVLGIADIAFDILSTILMAYGSGEQELLLKLSLTCLYLLQVLLPYGILCYTCTLRDTSEQKQRRFLHMWGIPSGVMGLMVLINCWSGIFFYFD